MSVSIWQATLFGIFACLASLPGMGGTVVGNYTLGRPLVGGLICGLIMGDVATGIIAGAAIQIVYIALITPGGAVAADVRADICWQRAFSTALSRFIRHLLP